MPYLLRKKIHFYANKHKNGFNPIWGFEPRSSWREESICSQQSIPKVFGYISTQKTENETKIPSGAVVKIIKILNENILLVEML